MSYTMTYSNGRVPNQVKEFTVDAKSDIDSIDISQILPGSRAFVIDDSQWYMLNNQWQWKPVDLGSGSSSGGGGSEDYDHIYYDGGSEDGDTTDRINYDGGSEDG